MIDIFCQRCRGVIALLCAGRLAIVFCTNLFGNLFYDFIDIHCGTYLLGPARRAGASFFLYLIRFYYLFVKIFAVRQEQNLIEEEPAFFDFLENRRCVVKRKLMAEHRFCRNFAFFKQL